MGRLLTLHGPGDAEDLIGEPRRRQRRPDDHGTMPDPASVMSERIMLRALRDTRRALIWLTLAIVAVGAAAILVAAHPP